MDKIQVVLDLFKYESNQNWLKFLGLNNVLIFYLGIYVISIIITWILSKSFFKGNGSIFKSIFFNILFIILLLGGYGAHFLIRDLVNKVKSSGTILLKGNEISSELFNYILMSLVAVIFLLFILHYLNMIYESSALKSIVFFIFFISFSGVISQVGWRYVYYNYLTEKEIMDKFNENIPKVKKINNIKNNSKKRSPSIKKIKNNNDKKGAYRLKIKGIDSGNLALSSRLSDKKSRNDSDLKKLWESMIITRNFLFC